MSFLSIIGVIFLLLHIAALIGNIKKSFNNNKNIFSLFNIHNIIYTICSIWIAIATVLMLNVGPGFYGVNFWNK